MRSKLLPLFVIFALASVAVFGFLSVSAMDMEHSGSSPCLFSVFTQSKSCMSLQSAIAVAAHYLDMAGWLLGALASFDIFALIFSLLFLLALFVVSSLVIVCIAPPQKQSFFERARGIFVKEKHALLRWLSFHGKRDPYALARVHSMNLRF